MPVNEGSQCTHFGFRREICLLLSPPSISDGRGCRPRTDGRVRWRERRLRPPRPRVVQQSVPSTNSARLSGKSSELCLCRIFTRIPQSLAERLENRGILFRSLPEMSYAMPDLRQDPPSSIYLSFYLSMHRKDGSVAHQFASSPPFLSSPLLSATINDAAPFRSPALRPAPHLIPHALSIGACLHGRPF